MKNAPDPRNTRVVSSTFSLGIFSVISLVLGLGTTIIITRYFSTVDFGIYTIILLFVSFLSQFSTFGVEMSVSRQIAGATEENSRERIFGTAITLRLVVIVLASLLAWLGEPLLRKLFGQSLVPAYFFYAPLLFGLESIRSLLKSALQGSFLFPSLGISDTIASIINFLLLILVVYGLKGNIIWLILAKSTSSIIASIYTFAVIPFRKRISFHLDEFKELIKFGMPLQANDILSFIFLRIDTIVIAAFLGPTDIALYEIARKIPDYIRNLYEPFRSVYYPFIAKRFAHGGSGEAKGLANDSIRLVTFVTLFGTATVYLFGKEIIQLLFSDKYLMSAPIFTVLMVNLSIALSSNVMGTSLVAIGDSKKPLIINIFNAAGSWLGCVLLVPIYFIFGAAVATTIGTLIAYPLNVYFLRKRIDFNLSVFIMPTLLFCAWFVLVIMINPVSFLLKTGLLLVFLVVSFFVSIITKKDIVNLLDGSGITAIQPFQKLAFWISHL